ncbi:glycoside hydrolase family 13 protein [uncultured Treponema sp.]|uniref:glycoside hydrolase family 13 protein n=1 Tax=uncultured Treponema sp. TaxID=162155 RepID=UPI0025EDE4AD|nr:glycoside hydrolase family 13 protein [uncultured Treponema sp.]
MKEWLKSVYSDTSINFVSNPLPKRGETITFSIRMLKNSEIRDVFLRSKEFGVESVHLMKEQESEGSLAYYRVSLPIRDKKLCYQFYLRTDDQIFYYTRFSLTDYIPDDSADFVLLADYDYPHWVNDTVFYQIFPDRFCNGDKSLDVKKGEYSYQGFEARPASEWGEKAKKYEEGRNLDFHNGDLYGIIEKLDYLQELGINGIYLNPIFLSPSTHKYDALDYFKIDPHLGGDEALAKLTEQMHKRGMRLLLDISINHTSSSAKWFNKDSDFYPADFGAYNNPESAERKFYFFDKDNHYDTWFGVPTMPQLNYSSDELRKIIYRDENSVLKKWLKKPFDIDGWRFDVADCLARNEKADVHDEVIREIHTELKSVKKDAYLVAEEWGDCSSDLQGEAWDATMNYFGCARVLRAFAGAKDLFHERNEILGLPVKKMTAQQLKERICQFYARLPGPMQFLQFNLIDSHDVIRLHNISSVKESGLKAAVTMLFTLPGAPSVYYGDEIFLDGSEESIDECRYPFDWNWEEKQKSIEVRNFYKKLIQLRRNEEALRSGSFAFVSSEDYVAAFARFTRKEVIFTICSADSENRTVALPLSYFNLRAQKIKKDCLGKQLESRVEGDSLIVEIPANESYVIKMQCE